MKASDRIAYIIHDLDDALRTGVIKSIDLPKDSIELLGDTHKKRIDTLVKDMISNSDGKPVITLSDEKLEAMNNLRSFMFENVYHNEEVKQAEDVSRVETIVTSLYEYFLQHPDRLPADIREMKDIYPVEELVKDHVASMTDRYAYNMYNELFVPVGWNGLY
ncbi:MAG: hypothetical protein MJ144_02080 [Clostridia bacterium]|nr:hypothetical protein [Clostridia bacterium]